MKKVRLFLDETKEQKWINEMSEQGWHFEHYNPLLLTFSFKKGEPGAYTYCIDSIFRQDDDYIGFVESTGAELVYKNMYWAYFRKPKAEGDFKLYTDYSSKLNYLNRLLTLYTFVMLLNLMPVLYNGVLIKGFLQSSLWLTDVVILLNVLCIIVLTGLITITLKRKRKLKETLSIF